MLVMQQIITEGKVHLWQETVPSEYCIKITRLLIKVSITSNSNNKLTNLWHKVLVGDLQVQDMKFRGLANRLWFSLTKT